MTPRGAPPAHPWSQSGFAMPALLAMLAIMTFALMLAMPSWRYVVKDDKEQELIFRGRQISTAIARFQRKNGNALPTSFDQLVKGKYLRKAYKDPLVPDGAWRIVRPGEVVTGRPGAPGGPAGGPRPTPTPTPSPTPAFGGNSGAPGGPIAGVASLSKDDGLRLVNGNAAYRQWIFAPNIPFIVGAQSALAGMPPRGPTQGPPQGSGQRAPDVEMPRVSR